METRTNNYFLKIRKDGLADCNWFQPVSAKIQYAGEDLTWVFDSLANLVAWLRKNPEVVVDCYGHSELQQFAKDNNLKIITDDYEYYFYAGVDLHGALTEEEKRSIQEFISSN